MGLMNISAQISFVLCMLVASSAGLWSCYSDADCRTLQGSFCSVNGTCDCPYGQEASAGGTICQPGTPDYLSTCQNNFQCYTLVSGYMCGQYEPYGRVCHCREGFHYTKGRCWPTIGYGEGVCAVDEECLDSQLTDVYSLTCNNGTCLCADGYYLRQKGECRKIGCAPGEGCTLDSDCQFEHGACDYEKLICYDTTVGAPEPLETEEDTLELDVSSLGGYCDTSSDCSIGLECSRLNHCTCPRGYYFHNDGCYANLGSPSTKDLCIGFLSQVHEGECKCPANFYYDMDMRNCIKATLRFTDACVTDANCYTFGRASHCGQPTEPWGYRYCECDTAVSIKDETQNMCRLFSALGETCEQASDCYAGNVNILCLPDSGGINRCTCPEHYEALDGLCVRREQSLGEECQVSDECDGSPNLICDQNTSRCVCSGGHFESNGNCVSGLGGACTTDADCPLNGMFCNQNSCSCTNGYIVHEETCVQLSTGYNSSCSFDIQCSEVMGDGSYCHEGSCDCDQTHTHSSGRCFEKKGLNYGCTASGECYMEMFSERLVCRNSICQCEFPYRYDGFLGFCATYSSAGKLYISAALISISLLKVFI